MATQVVKGNEILLNGEFYKIKGLVRPQLASVFPGKVTIGEYSKDDEPAANTWVISDQRGGMLVEEMVEDQDDSSFWWGNCNAQFKGHLVLGRLATAMKADKIVAPTGNNDPSSAWVDEAKAYNNDISDYAEDAVVPAETWSSDLELTVASTDDIRAIRYYCSGGNAAITQIDIDVYNGSWHDVYEGTFTQSTWELKALSSVLDSVTKVRIKLYNSHASVAYDVRVHDVDFIQEADTAGTPRAWANYNGELYVGIDKYLEKLNSGGTAFEIVTSHPPALFEANILQLRTSLNNKLYIFQGDADNYWHMTTAEVFAQSNSTGCTLDTHWDAKLYKMDSAGDFYSSLDPDGATPTWSAAGNLTNNVGILDGDVKGLIVYRDSDGNQIIYAGTTQGLYAHDSANAKFIETELLLPDHPNCGKGLCTWRSALYVSAGLDIFEYIARQEVSIRQVGLDRRDGLPSTYRGEIVKLIKGYNEFFALVDASQATGTGYSGVYGYDGRGWSCWWKSSAADGAMNSGIISSAASEYRLYYDESAKIYSIDLERNIRNPLQLTTSTYATSTVHVTGRFDAGVAWNKTAIKTKAICDQMSSSNEEIVVKYRINEDCYTAIDSNWTTLVTLDTDGETETQIASGAGIAFKVIQFRFELSRRAGDNTKTPDLQRFTLVYDHVIPTAWAFGMMLDITAGYRGRSPEQQWQDLETILAGGVLVPFTYISEDGAAETHYVNIRNLSGEQSTGLKRHGMYSLSLLAP